MPTTTDRRVALTMATLRLLRESGIIPTDAAISPAGMAWVSKQIGEPVSKTTFRRIERLGRVAARAYAEQLLEQETARLSQPRP